MLVARALPAGLGASSKMYTLFPDGPLGRLTIELREPFVKHPLLYFDDYFSRCYKIKAVATVDLYAFILNGQGYFTFEWDISQR